jgi:hypothetical protein
VDSMRLSPALAGRLCFVCLKIRVFHSSAVTGLFVTLG